jgi:hypothetical protein
MQDLTSRPISQDLPRPKHDKGGVQSTGTDNV